MCGISAIFSRSHDTSQIIKKMTDSLYHRGPDDGQCWTSDDRKVSLGQRRLAILDLSPRGRQPMFTKDGNGILVYNGEIYNFKEIRNELVECGYTFNSTTDSEVLLAGIQKWGLDVVQKLNGMWAFVYYDLKQKKIFLSRDRAGIKPIYYFWNGETLIVGSEIKAILASGLISVNVDLLGLNEYFTFQNIISDRTLFKDIKMLEAGYSAVLDLANFSFKKTKYWDFDFTPDLKLTEDVAKDMFKNEFSKAVERHMISDVDVGATISGGMDSSAIVSEAVKHVPNLQTFNGWFDTSSAVSGDRSFSERNDAKLVSEYFKTVHHDRLISWQDQMDSMSTIVWHLEDPKVGMSYTFLNISHLVSQNVTVNLSGTGGDEIFAGYPWRYSLIDKITNKNEFKSIYYNYWSRVISDNQKQSFFTDKARKEMNLQHANEVFESALPFDRGWSPVNQALYFEAKTFLHGMLMVEDKLGMAYSIETRFPFLDVNLINIAQKIPDHLKYKDGIGKYIFRRAFEDTLPKEITQKKKQGFTPPDFTYYQRELSPWIHYMLLGRRTLCHDFIEREFIENILDRHQKGEDMRFQIWSLLFFEGWCRTFLANNTSSPAFRIW